MNEFTPVPNHINFKAKKLFAEMGLIKDGSIACLEPNGGGPMEKHTHPYDHLFIVVKGQIKILLDDKTVVVDQNESFLLNGSIPHNVWNSVNEESTVIGITVTPGGEKQPSSPIE